MVDSEMGVETTRSGPELAEEIPVLAPKPAARDVLAEHPDALVAPHFLQGGATRRLDQCDFDHATAPVSCTSS